MARFSVPPGIQSIDSEIVETSFAVQGRTDGNQPTFTGDPLFDSSYVKTGNLVHFRHYVDMDNINSFGTGQYYMTLPFNAKYSYMFRQGCLHDFDTDRIYHISGEVEAGSNTMLLYTTDVELSSRIYDFPFTSVEPIALSTADEFHISGSYIAED